MRYDFLLLDWDGCLAKTLEVWFDAYKNAFGEYGVQATNQQIARHFGDWESPKYFGIEEVEACVKRISAIATANLLSVQLYNGAYELLMSARPSRHLVLLTNSKRNILLDELAHTGLTDCFELILTADDVIKPKPDPEIIERALATMGAQKENAIMIGDSSKDILAAKNAGIDSVLVYPDEHRLYYDFELLKQSNPTYIVSSFTELKPIIGIE
jgi:pyrophosphatase PpaX